MLFNSRHRHRTRVTGILSGDQWLSLIAFFWLGSAGTRGGGNKTQWLMGKIRGWSLCYCFENAEMSCSSHSAICKNSEQTDVIVNVISPFACAHFIHWGAINSITHFSNCSTGQLWYWLFVLQCIKHHFLHYKPVHCLQ